MIARLYTRHVMAALIALFVIGIVQPALAQAPAASGPQPSAGALLLAKQIVEIKGVQEHIRTAGARRGRKDQEHVHANQFHVGQ